MWLLRGSCLVVVRIILIVEYGLSDLLEKRNLVLERLVAFDWRVD